MIIKCKDHGRAQYLIESREQATSLKLRPATIHETMGPNYKDIYWSGIKNNLPMVKREEE